MSHPRIPTTKAAFSLVELSIVLVILGLLVGGVLSGQSLIRAAELRSITTEYSRYTTAMGSFRDKYFALPGDMSNAASFWASGTGNGDGDGKIENHGTAANNEISTFWIDLAFAGLIEGSYTNIAGTTLTAPTNNPKARLGNAVWNVIGLGTVGMTSASTDLGVTDLAGESIFEGTYGNALVIGAGTNAILSTGVLRAEEAWNIDTKTDDGRPASGSVLSQENQGENDLSRCSTLDAVTTTLAASEYSLTSTTLTACSLVFKTGY